MRTLCGLYYFLKLQFQLSHVCWIESINAGNKFYVVENKSDLIIIFCFRYVERIVFYKNVSMKLVVDEYWNLSI